MSLKFSHKTCNTIINAYIICTLITNGANIYLDIIDRVTPVLMVFHLILRICLPCINYVCLGTIFNLRYLRQGEPPIIHRLTPVTIINFLGIFILSAFLAIIAYQTITGLSLALRFIFFFAGSISLIIGVLVIYDYYINICKR